MTRQIIFLLAITLCFSCSNDKSIDSAQTKFESPTGNLKTNSLMDTINTDKFWSLIDYSVKISNGNNELQEHFLTTELTKLSLDEIKDFEIAFRKTIIDANDFKIMAAQKIIEGTVSDDSYLYFRCWLIGQGKTTYTETLKNPDYLADIVKKGGECEFESLMYVATNAYSKKTGKKEDGTFPRDVAIGMGLDYDFGAPPTKGSDWTESQLPTMYPRLWTKLK